MMDVARILQTITEPHALPAISANQVQAIAEEAHARRNTTYWAQSAMLAIHHVEPALARKKMIAPHEMTKMLIYHLIQEHVSAVLDGLMTIITLVHFE